MEKSTGSRPPPPVSDPQTPRKKGELCPLEAMLRGIGEPESWLMDCSPPAAAWELPPPQGEELEGELGSLEEVGAAFTEPSPAASSLGFWADECGRADAALAAAKAQMGRGCPEESLEGETTPRRGLAGGGELGVVDCTGSGHCAAAARGSRGSAAKGLPSLSKGRRRPRVTRRTRGRHQ